jgi:hypothetical protein
MYNGKGTNLNKIEPYCIYSEFSGNSHLNEELAITRNKTFYDLLKINQQ